MTNYKKESPKASGWKGDSHCMEFLPSTIEECLSEIIDLCKTDCQFTEDIIDAVRKAWDLVPEEDENHPFRKVREFCDKYWLFFDYGMSPNRDLLELCIYNADKSFQHYDEHAGSITDFLEETEMRWKAHEK